MSQRVHIFLYSLLGVALVAAIFFGVDSAISHAQTTQTLEDSYMQHVLESEEHLQALSIKLAKMPIASDEQTQVSLLMEISKQADQISTGLLLLPLSHIAMSDTIRFCNQMSEYSTMLALQVAGGETISDEDIDQLATLQTQSAQILAQLTMARETMIEQSIQMSNGSNAFYEEAQLINRPIEQLAGGDNGMDYPTLIYDGAFSDSLTTGTPKGLSSLEVSSNEQAQEIAVSFIGADRVKEVSQGTDTEGTIPTFGVTLTLHDGVILNCEISKQGGQMVWMMPEVANFESQLTLEECEERGKAFLLERGFGEVEAKHYQMYDGMAIINFVPMQDGVLLYPDLIKLQLRMDSGEVVGMETKHYLMNHTERETYDPTITEEEIRTLASDHLSIESLALCIIPINDEEVFCYELIGIYNEQTYYVYLDAHTGEEKEVLLVVDTVSGELSA